MKLIIGETEYTDLVSIDFSPETNVVGETLPINQFAVDVRTDDGIGVNLEAQLVDDDGMLWAQYTIIDVQTIQGGIKRVIAQSSIALLAKRNLPAIVYDEAPILTVLSRIFPAGLRWALDFSYDQEVITGYFPEQTARERLLEICFSLGLWVKTYFDNKVSILPLADDVTDIPLEQTYWMPQISYKDYVTKVTIRTYSYTKGTPQASDDYVKAGGNTYIESYLDVSQVNPDVPSYVQENEIIIRNIHIMNDNNVSRVLALLANYYFNRTEVKASALNNGEFYPGQKVSVFMDRRTQRKGYIQSMNFNFGVQAKSTFTMVMTVDINMLKLLIKYMWNNTLIGQKAFMFAKGANYVIDNPYIDKRLNKKRYIFRPIVKTTEGVMGSTDKVVEVEYDPALVLNTEKVLYVISVDGLTEREGIVEID